MKQKSSIKYLTIIFTIIILSLILVGCQEGNNKESINVTNQNIDENIVSDEYRENVKAYLNQLSKYMDEFNMHHRNNELHLDNAITLYEDGIIFASENANLNPQNKADRVLDEHLFNTNYHFKQTFEYMLKAIKSKDKTYATLASDELVNYNQEIAIVRELLVRYGVNN